MGVCATKDAYMHFKHTISFVFWTKIIFMTKLVFAESFLLLGTNPTDKCCWISFLFRASVSTRSERRFSRLLKLAPVAVFQAWGLCESVAPWKSMHVQLSSKPWQACHLNAALAGDSEVMLCGHERGRRRNRALPALNHRQSSLFWWLVKSSSVWKPFFLHYLSYNLSVFILFLCQRMHFNCVCRNMKFTSCLCRFSHPGHRSSVKKKHWFLFTYYTAKM